MNRSICWTWRGYLKNGTSSSSKNSIKAISQPWYRKWGGKNSFRNWGTKIFLSFSSSRILKKSDRLIGKSKKVYTTMRNWWRLRSWAALETREILKESWKINRSSSICSKKLQIPWKGIRLCLWRSSVSRKITSMSLLLKMDSSDT